MTVPGLGEHGDRKGKQQGGERESGVHAHWDVGVRRVIQCNARKSFFRPRICRRETPPAKCSRTKSVAFALFSAFYACKFIRETKGLTLEQMRAD
jgi:hypothetical protein